MLQSETERVPQKYQQSPAFKEKLPMNIDEFGGSNSAVSGIPIVSAVSATDRNFNNADLFSDTNSRKKQVRFTNVYDG